MVETLDKLIDDLCKEIKKNRFIVNKYLLTKALALLVEARAKIFS